VDQLRARLAQAGAAADVEFQPNIDRAAKVAFYRSLTVLSVPAEYGEAFGLYVLEALAAGVPVVQPRTAAFPELIEATGGGLLCAPGSPAALAEAIGSLLADPARARALGDHGRVVVGREFTAARMADHMERTLAGLLATPELAPRSTALGSPPPDSQPTAPPRVLRV
jgi:glycosyltransferase involved in cell wall biosynthesis